MAHLDTIGQSWHSFEFVELEGDAVECDNFIEMYEDEYE